MPKWLARSPTDIAQVSPETEVRLTGAGHRRTPGTSRRSTARSTTSRAPTRSQPEQEDYLVHITTGTHVAQICLFLLTESRHLPARLIQTSPPPSGRRPGGPGRYAIIDLDLSKYDRLASRFRQEQREGALVPQVRHRHAQRRLQPAHRADRAGGHGLSRAAAAHRAHRRRQVAAGPAHLRAEEGAAAGERRVRGGQLRHAARRRRHVRALRPRQGRLHRRA